MYDRDNARTPATGNGRAPARPAAGAVPFRRLLDLQATAGNAAVVQLLRRGGQLAPEDSHQHGAGCGHQAEQPQQPQVQRSAVHDVLRGGGRPLDQGTRTEMESRLGADFSDVRIHTDSAAKASAAELGARAYTSGSHVVIGDGGGDKHTLAHELTHVVQQRTGPVAGTDNGNGLRVSDPSDRFEREAEANATRVMSGPAAEVQRAPAGRTAGRAGSASPAASIQRAPGGGHLQGDHIFNALGSTGENVADTIAECVKEYLKAVDSGIAEVSKPPKGDRAAGPLYRNRSNRTANLAARLRRLRAASTEAEALGHPSSEAAAHYSFIATLATQGLQGDDPNSTTFGTFAGNLVGLARTATAVNPLYDETPGTWAVPEAFKAGLGTWSPFLASKIFDDDARSRVLAERVGNRTAEFNTWLTNTKAAYADLYQVMIEAIEELRSLVLWFDAMQRNTYYSETRPPDFAAHAGATPDLLNPPNNAAG
ncbi:hypothetical protein GCM10009738_48680 [Kitasatospora viridis]|uniref:Uncharacterized protein DUF4157 n=1 Tax=Kitasatospora viridis TaxID=281105 RepID=A0A561UHR1_9ACTN|nr:DUF4157 domain-containing protein [Kitasatospora viridis]TWF98893.1 uncharacterized protein DUF4157 [Kitasatospora viridis]